MRATLVATALGIVGAAGANIYTGSGFAIADSDGTDDGVSSSTIAVANTGLTVASIDSVTLTGLTHTYIGDLEIALSNGVTSVDLVYASAVDWANFDGTYTFVVDPTGLTAEEASLGLSDDDALASGSYAISTQTDGVALGARTSYAAFSGLALDGAWILTITDTSSGDTGALGSWTLNVTPQPVPESSVLAALGLGALALLRRRPRAVRGRESAR